MRTTPWIALALVVMTTCNEKQTPPAGTGSSPPAPATPSPPAPPPTVDAAAAPAPVATAEQAIAVPFLVDTTLIKVKAKVPVGWKRRDPIPTWDPPDANQLPMWHRSYEITATCDGGCTAKELGPRVAKYLDAVKARKIKPRMSGDPMKDENTVAPVTELERGPLPQGGEFMLLRVEKPVGSTDPYPDLFVGVCVTRRPDDEFFVITNVAAAPDDEKTWWPVLVEACKATTIDPTAPAEP